MFEEIKQPIKVYVKTNKNNEIIDINSEIFIDDFSSWIYYDEGFGDKYAHAQSQYFDKPLYDENGNLQIKLENNKI